MITVAGRIIEVTKSAKGDQIHLHFDKAFHKPLSFAIPIRGGMPKESSMMLYVGRVVEISGQVMESDGVLQLKAAEPAHIELLPEK